MLLAYYCIHPPYFAAILNLARQWWIPPPAAAAAADQLVASCRKDTTFAGALLHSRTLHCGELISQPAVIP